MTCDRTCPHRYRSFRLPCPLVLDMPFGALESCCIVALLLLGSLCRVQQSLTAVVFSHRTSSAGCMLLQNRLSLARLSCARGMVCLLLAAGLLAVVRGQNYNDIITTFAGTGSAGSSGDGGAATSAQLNSPTGVAVDSSGNVYIADSGNDRIRKVAVSTGIITTFAGTGSAGSSGDGGKATSALLNNPLGVAVDSSGNVYISDSGNHRIRKVVTELAPTSQPSSQPSRQPSTQPSRQPSSRPSAQPTSNPSFASQSAADRTLYVTGSASAPVINTTLTNLGHGSTVYLSALLQTSFLSSTSNAHVAIRVYSDSRMQAGTAQAITNTSCYTATACLSVAAVECAANYRIPPQTRSSSYGGSVFVVAYVDLRTFEGAKTYCTASDVQFRMELTISLGHGQPTVSPTELPTLVPSRSSGVSTINTVQTAPTTLVDLNNIQYYFIVIFLAAYVGVGFLVVRVREKDAKLAQLELKKVSIMMAVQGVSLISELFYVSVLFSSSNTSFVACAAVILAVRICHMVPAVFVLANILEPCGLRGIYSSSVDKQAVFNGDALYGAVIIMAMLEFQLCILLPWRNGSFAKMSFGYPTYNIFRTGVYLKTVQTLISTIIQVYFIASDTSLNDSAKVFNGLNLAITLINLLLNLVKGFLKMNILLQHSGGESSSSDVVDFEMSDISAKPSRDSEGAVSYTTNPLVAGSAMSRVMSFARRSKADSATAQDRISRLESELADTRAELQARLESELADTRGEVGRLGSQLAMADSAATQDRISRLESELADTRVELGACTGVQARLESELADTRVELGGVQARLESELADTRAELRAEVGRLGSQLADVLGAARTAGCGGEV